MSREENSTKTKNKEKQGWFLLFLKIKSQVTEKETNGHLNEKNVRSKRLLLYCN